MLRICCKYLTWYIYLRLMRSVSLFPLRKFILHVNYLIFFRTRPEIWIFSSHSNRFLLKIWKERLRKQLRIVFMALSLVEGLSAEWDWGLKKERFKPGNCYKKKAIIDPKNHETSAQVLLLFRGWKHIFSHNTLSDPFPPVKSIKKSWTNEQMFSLSQDLCSKRGLAFIKCLILKNEKVINRRMQEMERRIVKNFLKLSRQGQTLINLWSQNCQSVVWSVNKSTKSNVQIKIDIASSTICVPNQFWSSLLL